jgi:cytosine permease
MNEKISGFEIKTEQRQKWQSIAMVWIGAMICVACLMVGGMLGSGLTLGNCVLAVLIGYSIICAYMCLMGMQGCDTGLPTAVMASGSLGEKGGKYVISAILAIACIGWFGIQASVCGASFSSMMQAMTGLMIPVWLSSVFWGIIMLATACFGFKGLKWLNYIAVPLLVIVVIYGVWTALARNDGFNVIASYVPSASFPLITGISLTIATFAVGGAIAGDYCRFAKSRKDVVKSSVLGVLPAGFLMLLIGATLSIVTGQYDISAVLSAAGVPAIGLIALILATWTTNVTNAYSGGLSLSVLLGLDEQKSRVATAIAGAVGTLLAAVGFISKFMAFLSLLTALVPALVGVMIADYWIIGRGRKENFRIRPGVAPIGLISYLAGAFIACLTGGTFASFPGLAFLNVPFFIGPINGIIVSMAFYTALTLFVSPAKEQKFSAEG